LGWVEGTQAFGPHGGGCHLERRFFGLEARTGRPPSAQGIALGSGSRPSEQDDEVKSTVLALIAEKTGYPPEMLDLDLDLEADLSHTVEMPGGLAADLVAPLRAAMEARP